MTDTSGLPTLQQLRSNMAELQQRMQQLREEWNLQALQMRKARLLNWGALALAAVATAVAWMVDGSVWMRTGLLPLVVVMVIAYEASRHVLNKVAHRKLAQLEREVAELQSMLDRYDLVAAAA